LVKCILIFQQKLSSLNNNIDYIKNQQKNHFYSIAVKQTVAEVHWNVHTCEIKI